MRIETLYFDKASKEHTKDVFSIVRKFLDSNTSIEHVIVATTEGHTGLAAAKEFKDRKIIVVSHQSGFVAPNHNELEDRIRQEIIAEGAKLLTTTHAFAGIPRGIRMELGGWQSTEIIAVALRTFCQGTKVCAEIAMMAADAGLVPVDRDVICIAGTGRGADTAWLLRPTNTHTFPRLRMKACLCKPIDF